MKSVCRFIISFAFVWSAILIAVMTLYPEVFGGIRKPSDSIATKTGKNSNQNQALWNDRQHAPDFLDDNHNNNQVEQQQQELLFYTNQIQSIQALLSERSNNFLDWKLVLDDFDIYQLDAPAGRQFYNHNHHHHQNNFHNVNDHNQNRNVNQTANQIENPFYYYSIYSKNLCLVAKAFETYRQSATAKPKPHVIWWQHSVVPNDNMMMLFSTSSYNNNEEALMAAYWEEQGCTTDDITFYINHPETLAVLLTHGNRATRTLLHDFAPKVHPMPPMPVFSPLQQQSTNNSSSRKNQMIDYVSQDMVTIVQEWVNNNNPTLTQKNPADNRTLPLLVVQSPDNHQPSRLEQDLSQVFVSPTDTVVYAVPQYYQPSLQQQHDDTDDAGFSYLDLLQHAKFVVADTHNPTVANNHNDESTPIEKQPPQDKNSMPERNAYKWIWEALFLGAIPILLEPTNPTSVTVSTSTTKNKNKNNNNNQEEDEHDWYLQTLLEDLPLITIDHYDQLTPAFLQQEYRRILLETSFSPYERLTQSYWVDLSIAMGQAYFADSAKQLQLQQPYNHDDDNMNFNDDDNTANGNANSNNANANTNPNNKSKNNFFFDFSKEKEPTDELETDFTKSVPSAPPDASISTTTIDESTTPTASTTTTTEDANGQATDESSPLTEAAPPKKKKRKKKKNNDINLRH